MFILLFVQAYIRQLHKLNIVCNKKLITNNTKCNKKLITNNTKFRSNRERIKVNIIFINILIKC